MPDYDRLVEMEKTVPPNAEGWKDRLSPTTQLCRAGGCGVTATLPARFPRGLCDYHERQAREAAPSPPNVLAQAEALIYGDRAATYGPADENMGAIIRMFNAWLDIRYLDHTQAVDLDSFDAVMFNVCIKTCRLAHSLRKDANSPHMDSVVDAAGYFGLIGKIIEERAAKAKAAQ